jgi:hypothetical protein
MRRFFLLSASLLLLTACGKTVQYTMTFDLDDAAQRTQLEAATVRVIQNRLLGQGKKLLSSEVIDKDDKRVLVMKVSDDDAAKILTESLTTPFTMTIMQQVETGGDISNEKYGNFKQTALTTEYFEAVIPREAEGGQGSAVITFTPEGQTRLQKLFKENRGETIGIFVRGVLMSKKLIDAKDTQNSISVDGIPSPGIAKVFADDVNVGLHVSFSELP